MSFPRFFMPPLIIRRSQRHIKPATEVILDFAFYTPLCNTLSFCCKGRGAGWGRADSDSMVHDNMLPKAEAWLELAASSNGGNGLDGNAALA